MPQQRTLDLSEHPRQELLACRDRDPRPSLRERAAALLKIAAGMKAAQVAKRGLLRPRDPDTVSAWLDRYQQEDLTGWLMQPGRGRKPAFSPSPYHHRASSAGSPPGGAT